MCVLIFGVKNFENYFYTGMEEESFMSMISIRDNLWSDDMIDVTSKSFTRMADIIQQQVKKMSISTTFL